jgi:hypothetical protein
MDICRALIYCEDNHIIHRDIKPENLFIDRFGNYKIGDFGVSRSMATVHMADSMTSVGTISYMAPEIFQGRSYNNTADIYSLGLILYQLLNNGRMPFLPTEGFYSIQDIDSANYRRLHGTPVPSLTGKTVRGAMVDRRLDAVVRKACAMDAADRYQTAKEFNDALALAETEEKKPLSVYRKRPQGSLAPAVYLQNRQQGSLASAVYLQNRPQERTRSENGIKLSGDMEPALDLNGMPQGRKKSESEKKTLTTPLPYRSYQSRSQRKGRRPGRHNKPVIIIVLLLFIAVAALAALHNRRRTISDSWEEIIAAGEDGTYIDKYKIGDTKELDLGEAGVIEMELVAFDADELADGSGKAPMTWIAKDLLDTEHAMNDNNSNEGGWPASDMRTWLRESILPMFPETVCSNIKEVKKYSYSSSDNETISSSDTIWIPSGREIFGEDDTREDEGPEYVKAFPHSAARRKYHIRASEPSWWWLRSASITIFDNSDCFDRVTGTGLEMSSTSASIEDGVAIGFCF